MKNMFFLIIIGLGTLPFMAVGQRLVDDRADKRVRALYANLQRLSGKGILFGHQDALAYGVHWKAEPGRSDVHISSENFKAFCEDPFTLFRKDLPRLYRKP